MYSFRDRRTTKRIFTRFKSSMAVFVIVMFTSLIANAIVKAYTFEGEDFDHLKTKEFGRGFIEIYSNRDEVCTSWVLIPGTELIDYWVLGIAYFLALSYLFLGVAIVADIFMAAIEVITSQTRRIKYTDEDGVDKFMEVSVWNPTIANLTLMALGSSAPEILLSIIGTITTLDEEPDELGSSTIVGSAAFNLLMITAVSIVAVPSGTVKKIDDLGVFFTTVFFSILAYVWLFIVLAVWTEDRITIAEAIITLTFFFILVALAYIADKINEYRMKKRKKEDPNADIKNADDIGRLFNVEDFFHILKLAKAEEKQKPNNDDTMKPDDGLEEIKEEGKEEPKIDNSRQETVQKSATRKIQLEAYLKETFKVDNVKDIDPEDVKQAIAPRSVIGRMKYRRVIGDKMAGKKPFVVVKGMKKQIENELANELKKEELNPYVGFKCLHYSVTEGAGHLSVVIYKKTQDALEIGIRTLDGTATAPDDYHSIDETLVFEKEEDEKTIKVEIVDDNEWEPDEDFLIELYDVNTSKRLKGKDTETRVTIIDDDKPGQIGFHSSKLTCRGKNKNFKVKVIRKHGCDGIVKVKYEVKEADGKMGNRAKPFEDFVPAKDTLIFEHGEIEKEIKIDLIKQEEEDPDRDDVFQIRLFDIEPEGAKITKKNK